MKVNLFEEEEKIAEIISNFCDGSMTEADCDILAMKIYEKNIVLKVQQIADLEAKLAEYDHIDEIMINAGKKIKDLQKQLAEKDKEIETLIKLKAKEMGKSLYGVVGSLAKIINESVDMAKAHQDKIAFAVEQLEKVKEKLNDYDIQEILSSSSDPYGEFDENCVTTDNINTIIDNQINQLKEGK